MVFESMAPTDGAPDWHRRPAAADASTQISLLAWAAAISRSRAVAGLRAGPAIQEEAASSPGTARRVALALARAGHLPIIACDLTQLGGQDRIAPGRPVGDVVQRRGIVSVAIPGA